MLVERLIEFIKSHNSFVSAINLISSSRFLFFLMFSPCSEAEKFVGFDAVIFG